MLTLNNVACGDTYTPAATLGPVINAASIVFTVANNSAVLQIAASGAPQNDWGTEILVTPTSGVQVYKADGIRFRNAVAGSVARVVAQLSQPSDPVVVGGTPFTGVLASSGGGSTLGVLNYTEFTTSVSTTTTTEGTATTIVSMSSPIVLDGNTAIKAEFYCPQVFWVPGTANPILCILFDDLSSTVLGTLGRTAPGLTSSSPEPLYMVRRFTPVAGTYKYSMRAYLSGAGTGTFVGGVGGSGGVNFPGFIKVSTDS